MRYTYVNSPIGPLLVAGDERGLRVIRFTRDGRPAAPEAGWEEDRPPTGELRRAADQLGAYFRGDLVRFDLKLAPRGTPFQLEAWRLLRRIPYGRTISYGEQARRLGRPSADRAVGAANARNPLPIVTPCHRVVGADGRLVGFGGGLGLKRWLLDHERRRTGGRKAIRISDRGGCAGGGGLPRRIRRMLRKNRPGHGHARA